jgi:hypothetical protein
MRALNQLNEYLRGLERRLRWKEASRGAALLGVAALGLTIALVVVVNALAFSMRVC